MTASTERPTPETDVAYAVQMSNGYYVGIWTEKESAESICAKAPGGKGDRVVEMVPAEALASERSARAEAEREALLARSAEVNAKVLDAAAEVLRISDRKHEAWDQLRAALAELERGDGKGGS